MDWGHDTQASQQRWEKQKAAFLQQYPNVDIQAGFYDDFDKKLPVLVASGTPPDEAPLRRQAEFPALAPQGVLADLTPFLAKSGVLHEADFYPSTVAMQSLDGKLYALPTTIDMYWLFYNKDLFDAGGVKYPDLSWDYDHDWIDAARRLTKRQGDQIVQAGAMMPSWWPIHYATAKNVAMWEGGTTDPSHCTRALYDSPGVIQAYQWYQDVLCKERVGVSSDKAKAQGLLFENGKLAMWLSYDQRSYYHDSVKNFNWDCMIVPLGDKGQARVGDILGNGGAIFALSKVKDVAWSYLEFTNAPAYLLQSVQTNGAAAAYANRQVQESAAYKASSVPPSDKSLVVQNIQVGKFWPQPSWEMLALKIPEPALPKNMPDPTSCGGDVKTAMTAQAQADNAALKAHGISVCG
jgi:multiple sugar transport system substrate-binding protein